MGDERKKGTHWTVLAQAPASAMQLVVEVEIGAVVEVVEVAAAGAIGIVAEVLRVVVAVDK
jgi:hypothetical protein